MVNWDRERGEDPCGAARPPPGASRLDLTRAPAPPHTHAPLGPRDRPLITSWAPRPQLRAYVSQPHSKSCGWDHLAGEIHSLRGRMVPSPLIYSFLLGRATATSDPRRKPVLRMEEQKGKRSLGLITSQSPQRQPQSIPSSRPASTKRLSPLPLDLGKACVSSRS